MPGESSAWHRVTSDELWLHQRGGALTLRLSRARPEGAGSEGERTELLGADYTAGQRPQVLVPAGWWQSASPAAAEPVLVACVVVPGFDFADFTLLDDPAQR